MCEQQAKYAYNGLHERIAVTPSYVALQQRGWQEITPPRPRDQRWRVGKSADWTTAKVISSDNPAKREDFIIRHTANWRYDKRREALKLVVPSKQHFTHGNEMVVIYPNQPFHKVVLFRHCSPLKTWTVEDLDGKRRCADALTVVLIANAWPEAKYQQVLEAVQAIYVKPPEPEPLTADEIGEVRKWLKRMSEPATPKPPGRSESDLTESCLVNFNQLERFTVRQDYANFESKDIRNRWHQQESVGPGATQLELLVFVIDVGFSRRLRSDFTGIVIQKVFELSGTK